MQDIIAKLTAKDDKFICPASRVCIAFSGLVWYNQFNDKF